MKKILPIFFAFFLFLSCAKDDDNNFGAQTEADILKYIEDNNLSAERTNSGLFYVINELGNGARPTSSSNVTVAYKGYFLNGNVFDQNQNGYTTNLNRVISGWTEGIQLFKEGGSGVLLIPSKLGYGDRGNSSILEGLLWYSTSI
ncbi:FKBP-type peptidyl-prolyl cis-trans isomerase [Polaribacter sp. HL-MS24]|uniref:FKBP-type peptidyl-prolyl cis-trans isomerase n=1 Tax=Polaribacter sp. HL-MS24 TaxID=3077735 RepID=UPI0029347A5E|nr:FKBP-type peptidyl-prolyl cis-trans isomerase [Polaribacter sp. HL-MS24]WOC40813.1 FKBP-type peptidyl-prolyl cis-trans isomerase [Polaribacter sp. HL-MS24]